MDNDITMETLGKSLGIGRNNLYHLFRTCGVLNKDNLPNQRFRGMGLFKILSHDVIDKKQTLFTPRGAEWFKQRLQLLIVELQSIQPLKHQGGTDASTRKAI